MYALTSVKQLQNRGYDVCLIASPDSRLYLEAHNQGVMLLPIKASGYFHPVQSLKLSRILKYRDYDLIHTQASKDLWVLVPALRIAQSNIPLVLTKQVGSFIEKKDTFHKSLYKRVDKLFAISSVIKQNLLDTTPVDEKKISILHNAIDTKKFDPENYNGEKVRREFSIPDENIVIGMTARFTPGKGHEEFLAAAQKLSKKHSNLTFLVIGEPSRGEDIYAEKIKALARSYFLENVIFAGYRSDMPECLAAMDIFVFPSHAEAFGIALVEALSMGLPTVCAAADGVLDIAVDNETSLLFKPKDADDLANKSHDLIISREKREQFRKNGRKRASKFFDIEYITDKVIGEYEALIKK